MVGAGLAVGTFCGLLFGVGTGPGGAAATPAQGSGNAVAAVTIDAGAPPPPPPPPDAAVAQAAPPDAAPAAVKAVLTFKVVPPVATEITVDGQPVTGDTFEVEIGDGARTVKIVAKAKGFRTAERQFAVTKDMVVPIALKKKGGGDGPGSNQPGGPIIDL